jgi:hypothetical protein
VIATDNEKADVVSQKTTASRILRDFYKVNNTGNEEDEKKDLIKAPAKLIRNDVKNFETTNYNS